MLFSVLDTPRQRTGQIAAVTAFGLSDATILDEAGRELVELSVARLQISGWRRLVWAHHTLWNVSQSVSRPVSVLTIRMTACPSWLDAFVEPIESPPAGSSGP